MSFRSGTIQSVSALSSPPVIPALTPAKLEKALQAAFRDPSSPFHIPPGTQGPSSPDPPSDTEDVDPLKAAAQKLTEAGFDPASFWEQRIVWGDQDAFHRMKWVLSIGHELGGQTKAEAMIKGQGVSLILKSIEVRFRRPVTFPDTVRPCIDVHHGSTHSFDPLQLLIGYRPKDPSSDSNIDSDPAVLNVTASAYSVSQQTIVATSSEVLVWYNYDRLKKCVPSEETLSVVLNRMRSSS
ncbi:hypothetical protein C0989_009223 [Termitomyces sp. Mn162]|nr:hypothetical protein C0989_009223 [Termitomyces sp. Mn162]